ncbi:MAG: NAD(P)/FAD-dependent oxidoreductase [Flavobacteriales bacterium]|nr:NAD(P)/FAD-dependent oxidoreductase [Flavobacteriales bacterium]
MRIVVIGGGAAGYFAAIHARTTDPTAEVFLFERTRTPLAKVRISGGGRCNVTHDERGSRRLAANYPRGERFLRKAFQQFAVNGTVEWFAARGVRLKTEKDGRMFPVSDRSSTIIEALQEAAARAGVRVRLGLPVTHIRAGPPFLTRITDAAHFSADRVIVATGGAPRASGLQWLQDLGVAIVPPVPSLFTLNLPEDGITALMGVTVDRVRLTISGTRIEATGPLLITHWGLSGPAALRLSAWGAIMLHERGYETEVRIDWTGGTKVGKVHSVIDALRSERSDKILRNCAPFGLPNRVWTYLVDRVRIRPGKRCGDLGRHDRDRLTEVLINDRHTMRGKTTFKEEFVTAGGVDLKHVDPHTMMSRTVPGLFFAGEVLDIDGITGGFNFQAAWTTGAIAGRHAVLS